MKIIGSTIVARFKYLTLFAISYLDRNGARREWHMVSRSAPPKCITGARTHPDAAIIVPYHRGQDKLVVIKEFRIPVGDYQYGFPAGLLDPGETLENAAARELREETGLSLVRIYRCSPAIFSSAGLSDESISMVFAEVDGKPSTHRNTDAEDIEVFLMDRQEVQALVKREDITFGARAWLAMDAFSKMGKDYF